MARSFNTSGPCRPDRDYMLPPLARLPEATRLVAAQKYFVVHAPRQTGKTTAVRALADELRATGEYAALAFTCEAGRVAGDDFMLNEQYLLDEIRSTAEASLPRAHWPPEWPQAPAGKRLSAGLRAWARACTHPLVLVFDEIDALAGKSLISVLSQLRGGYADRPENFPASVVLCGMRNVRDYRAAAVTDSDRPEPGNRRAEPSRLGTSSPFNVAVKALRMGDFSLEEIAELYGQHTDETGQRFTPEGIEYTYEITRGQPWLVNALAWEVIDEMGVPATETIGPRRLETAKERLIKARATHLDSLVAKLDESRVQRIIEPLLTGEFDVGPSADATYDDDVSYVRDLGLVAPDLPLRVANPIYREIIPRALGARSESLVPADPRCFVQADGTLAFDKLLSEFAAFWKQHGDVLATRDSYHEAAPQLVLMAFLHRLVNGGGYVDREYGTGRGRIDLHIRWPYDRDGKRHWQREAIELKVWRQGRPDPLADGLRQLDDYLARLNLDHGTLVVFDRRNDATPLPERVAFSDATTPGGRKVTLLRA